MFTFLVYGFTGEIYEAKLQHPAVGRACKRRLEQQEEKNRKLNFV
jgi:hypothetical protein